MSICQKQKRETFAAFTAKAYPAISPLRGRTKKSDFRLDSLSNHKPTALYEELKPTFHLMRIFGLAPFSVLNGKLSPSKKFLVQNSVLAILTFYCAYAACMKNEYDVSNSALSVLLYKIIGTCRSAHIAICLCNFAFSASIFHKIWMLIQDINNYLQLINIHFDTSKHRIYNLLATIGFSVAFLIFSTLYATFVKIVLSPCLWTISILPYLYNCLLIFVFCVLTDKLKVKFSSASAAFREDLLSYEGKDRSRRNPFWDDENDRKESQRILRNIQVFKLIHLKVYKTVQYLNKLFGFHFFIIFIMYFWAGTLHSFTVIRYLAGQTSRAVYTVSACAIVGETCQVALAIYGATVLEKEVHSALMAVHKFLTVINEYDVNLENELQSFAIQLHQCRIKFSAAGFFAMDYTKLLQFGVAFFSNAVFLIQIDEIKNAKKVD